jgi:hypothetical protein
VDKASAGGVFAGQSSTSACNRNAGHYTIFYHPMLLPLLLLSLLLLSPQHTQAYMSALTSSVNILEQRIGQLDSSGGSLSGQLNLAFGSEAQQREAQADVQLTNMFRVRIVALLLLCIAWLLRFCVRSHAIQSMAQQMHAAL